MPDTSIVFPGLGLSFDPSRVAFSLGDKPIYWYGVIIGAGFLLAAIYTMLRTRQFGIRQDDFLDALIIATPVAIVCARLYFVAFTWDQFKDDLISILFIWEGGVAIYGGIIGAAVAAWLVCRHKKLSFLALMDLASIGLILGQGIGRWGNFINREAHGGVTDLPWRMEIYVAEAGERLCVHPTFFYESAWCLLGFLVLHLLSKHRKFDGEVFFTYVAWYGLGRGFIEGLRTDSLYLIPGVIRVSQVVGFLSCLAAVALLIVFARRKSKRLSTAQDLLPKQEEQKKSENKEEPQ